METLHMCIRKENGHYWFYNIDEGKIPLQVLKNQSPESVFEKESHKCIDSATGSHWRDTYVTNDETLKGNITFTWNILFTFHHAITDGYTAMREKKTKFIHGELNKEITANLIKVFKSKGISFHAGFVPFSNWVLMDILIENGLTDEEIELLSKTDKNVGDNFWEYAKEFNKELKSVIENMQEIDRIAVKNLKYTSVETPI
ncbi:hypothetical protein Anas_14755 [Armadillidium nasatum]|uniref:Uncharacterized protein n=1 Tax=Armadillidium nasatum TaxID=96803 RepID=A0A5N5T5R7_9CRUS|nr:hypothetical protein Anas_14755 [Armadillidium nasatum]